MDGGGQWISSDPNGRKAAANPLIKNGRRAEASSSQKPLHLCRCSASDLWSVNGQQETASMLPRSGRNAPQQQCAASYVRLNQTSGCDV
ncbi:hypothetical protein AGIG_G16422 [Arapaima gigas]